jgi:ElaB/YqjD/DUF883 family membrane-anchored ribosome-binding protein
MNERHIHRAPQAASGRRLAQDAAETGGNLFDNTREFAAQALERAAHRMRDLREGVADSATAAQRQVGAYTDATRRYVADQPLRAALIAAAVGALVTAAILMLRRRSGRY